MASVAMAVGQEPDGDLVEGEDGSPVGGLGDLVASSLRFERNGVVSGGPTRAPAVDEEQAPGGSRSETAPLPHP
jgi:hypothetical protein